MGTGRAYKTGKKASVSDVAAQPADSAEKGSRMGRPSGTDLRSQLPVKLSQTDSKSYKYFRKAIATLPLTVQDAISEVMMTRGRLSELNIGLRNLSSGIWASFPLICCGKACPYSARCPMLENGIEPIGMNCPIEHVLMEGIVSDYMAGLRVDPGNRIEMDQVFSIAMCDVMSMRVRSVMGKRSDGYSDLSAVGIDDNGSVILKRSVSVEVQVDEKYTKMKERLLTALLATREGRAKYDVANETDEGVRSSKLVELGAKILDKASTRTLDVLDVDIIDDEISVGGPTKDVPKGVENK